MRRATAALPLALALALAAGCRRPAPGQSRCELLEARYRAIHATGAGCASDDECVAHSAVPAQPPGEMGRPSGDCGAWSGRAAASELDALARAWQVAGCGRVGEAGHCRGRRMMPACVSGRCEGRSPGGY